MQIHLSDRASGVFILGFLLPVELSDRITACISYKYEILKIYILKVKGSKIKLLVSVYILHWQLHKKKIKFAILSTLMLDNTWVPSLAVFLCMGHDSGFNSVTSNLLSAQERSSVIFAVRIYHYFLLLLQSMELSHVPFLQFSFILQ